jgi:hypothetical protein
MMHKRMMAQLMLLATLLACSSTITTPVRTPTHLPPNPKTQDVLSFSFDDTTIFRDDLQPDKAGLMQEFSQTDIYHLETTLADDLLSLSGRMKVRYFNRMETDLEEVYFRLLPNLWGDLMQVSSVTVNGSPVTPRLENEDTALFVPLNEKAASGSHVDLGLEFTVTIPQDGSGNYGTFGFQDDTLTLAQFYPLIPLRDEEGWRIEIYPSSGDVTVAEGANYVVQIDAPESLILVCSGVQISRDVEGDRQVILQAAALSREFYVAASAEYKNQSLNDDEVTFTVYSHPETARVTKESLEYMAEAVSIFNQRFGDYPYNELELAATPTSAGGVEYPGVIAINQNLFDPDATWGNMNSQDVVESVVVHEVAHQWFYNMVGNDQGREPWLDEAMAQYMTWQYFQDRYGSAAGENLVESWWSRWHRVDLDPIPIGLPVESYNDQEYGAIVYGRGPLFLMELSKEMGTIKFGRFLKDYFETYSWKIATSQDFQDMAEATCGCELDQLFNEWVYIE